MTRLFIRVYLSLGAVLLACVALVVITGRLRDDDALPERFQRVADAHRLVNAHLADAVDPKSREAALRALADELGEPARLLPIAQAGAALDPLSRERLERGDPVVAPFADAPAAVLVRLPDQPLVAVVQPAGPRARLPWQVISVLVLLLGGIAFSVYATLRPLQRQLDALAGAARRFGAGEHAARAPVLGDDDPGRLADTFNEMADRVQQLLQHRQELLRAVSHELRTPVARLRFAVDMLADTDDEDDRQARADRIQADLEELDALIGELLAWSTLGEAGGALVLEPVDVAAELADLVDAARALRPEAQITVVDADPVPLEADRRLLRRAVSNLLSNAARYTQSRVEARVERAATSCRIVIDDDGPGVPVADRARIFDPLVRLDAARSRDTGGVGLGLALVRRIAEAHGGRVEVGDAPLGGARFTLDLPFERPQQKERK